MWPIKKKKQCTLINDLKEDLSNLVTDLCMLCDPRAVSNGHYCYFLNSCVGYKKRKNGTSNVPIDTPPTCWAQRQRHIHERRQKIGKENWWGSYRVIEPMRLCAVRSWRRPNCLTLRYFWTATNGAPEIVVRIYYLSKELTHLKTSFVQLVKVYKTSNINNYDYEAQQACNTIFAVLITPEIWYTVFGMLSY